MKNIKLSIIIPAYNVEKYISKCLDSISHNDKDIEIILIDDGSSDSTPSICDKYCKEKNNIKTIHIANGGQSKARNLGIDISCGEYIMFIDSDDYLNDPTFIDKILDIIDSNPDMIMYGYKKYWEGRNAFVDKKKINLNNLSFDYLISTNYFKGCPWDKVLKREIIINNNMRFPENMLSEDIDWCAQIILNVDASNIKVLNENPYIYVQHEGSTSKKIKAKHINDIYNILNKYVPNADVNNKLLLEYFAYEYCMSLGVINCSYCENINENIKNKFYEYKWLLKYNKCNKVRLCYYLTKVLGIRFSSHLFGLYVNFKKRGM